MMPSVSRSLQAVETLSRVDPVFSELCGVLYGPDVDAEQIWEDVFKADPDPADVNSPGSGSSLKRRLAFASTIAGGVLGARELASEAPKLVRAARTGKGVLVPAGQAVRGNGVRQGAKALAGSPAARTGVAGLALGGDALAGSELNPNKKQDGVNKLDTPGVGAMAEGIQAKLKRLMPGASKLDPKPAQPLGAARAGGDPSVSSAYSSGQRPAAPGAPDPAQAPLSPPAGPAQAGTIPTTTTSPTPGAPAGSVPPSGSAPASGASAQPTAQPASGTPGSESHQNGQAIGQLLGSATATPGRKVLVGGAVAAAALKMRSNQQQGQQQADPYASYYGKRDTGDFTAVVSISKLDDEKHLAFGWASVTKLDGRPVLDRQGDYIDADDLEDAAVRFMQDSRKGGHMHRRTHDDLPVHVSDIVESVVFTDEKVEKLGLPDTFPRGWWVGVKIHDPDVWEDVRKGGLPGFSIHGRGKRSPMDAYELAGVH